MIINPRSLLQMLALVGALLATVQYAAAEEEKTADTTKADNTKVNKRDKDGNELTADNQKQNKGDVEISAKIRQAIVKDDSLSTNAHNIKIITVDGIVTLKGPVKNETEKTTVTHHAVSVVGENNVKNQIDIVE